MLGAFLGPMPIEIAWVDTIPPTQLGKRLRWSSRSAVIALLDKDRPPRRPVTRDRVGHAWKRHH
jgi:hypothetical protein